MSFCFIFRVELRYISFIEARVIPVGEVHFRHPDVLLCSGGTMSKLRFPLQILLGVLAFFIEVGCPSSLRQGELIQFTLFNPESRFISPSLSFHLWYLFHWSMLSASWQFIFFCWSQLLLNTPAHLIEEIPLLCLIKINVKYVSTKTNYNLFFLVFYWFSLWNIGARVVQFNSRWIWHTHVSSLLS